MRLSAEVRLRNSSCMAGSRMTAAEEDQRAWGASSSRDIAFSAAMRSCCCSVMRWFRLRTRSALMATTPPALSSVDETSTRRFSSRYCGSSRSEAMRLARRPSKRSVSQLAARSVTSCRATAIDVGVAVAFGHCFGQRAVG